MGYSDKLESWVNFYNFLINDLHNFLFFCVCVGAGGVCVWILWLYAGNLSKYWHKESLIILRVRNTSAVTLEGSPGATIKSRKFCLWELSTSNFEYFYLVLLPLLILTRIQSYPHLLNDTWNIQLYHTGSISNSV